MNPIGGYFELELSKGENNFHKGALRFKSGRSSLHYILRATKPDLVYVPFYTCDGLLEPFSTAGVKYQFYEINEKLEPVAIPALKEKEYFIYINYFDLKREAVAKLSEQIGDRLIADCTQAFFMKGNGKSWFFNSCRKYFGVPDGSYLYAPSSAKVSQPEQQHEHYLVDHLLQRLNGHAREGYSAFQENEQLCGSEILAMSRLTEYLLSNVDYEKVIDARRGNFMFLHRHIKHSMLPVAELETGAVPMCYPFLFPRKPNRSYLYERDMFIPSFWNDVFNRSEKGFDFERSVSERLLPLPVDHRYNTEDMQRMINVIKEIQ